MDNQNVVFLEILKNAIRENRKIDLGKEIDWSYMVRLAKEHNVLPLFMEIAVKNPSYLSRIESEKEIRESMSVVCSQTKRTVSFLNLYKEFSNRGIYPIVMKGLICRELYDKLCDHRPSGDEDILIRLAEYEKAKSVLLEQGYLIQAELEKEEQIERLQEISFVHPEKKLHIELHFNPMGREDDIRSTMSDIFLDTFDDYREIAIQGVCLRTFNHQKHLLFLILHAFKHFTLGGFGVRQMLDVLLYQEKYGDEIDLEQVYEMLGEFRADLFWNDLLHIGNRYLGFKLPVFAKENCPDELLDDMIRCGVFGNKTQAEKTAGNMTMRTSGNFLENRGNNSFIMLFRFVFPNKKYMLDQAPYLKKKPWLLPVSWLKRWFNYMKKNRNNKGNLTVESIRISQRRMKLLKKYNLV